MSRVAYTDVQNIISTTLSQTIIEACITSANIMVTNGPATSTNPALSSTELFEIERWLSAHFVCIQDPVALREKIGDASQNSFPEGVTTAWKMGIGITVYGQQAIAMDRSGMLAKAGLMKGSFRAAPREDGDHFTRNLDKA